MKTLILIALAGAAAQLVDGGIGMGFGVTSTTILLLAGLGPAQASAVVHTAELGTTFVSGLSHWRFGNVHWPTVFKLGVPGSIAAFLGATVLSNISTDAAVPITSLILVAIGINLVWRFSQIRPHRVVSNRSHSTAFLGGLGLVGGFVDATGGGGWGPVSTSTLMAIGREQPRRIVGTVNTAEFLVTLGATLGFMVGLWHDIVSNFSSVLALLIGGTIAAPFAAWLVSRISPILLGGLVGTAIIFLNIDKVFGGAGTYFGLEVPTTVTAVIKYALLAVGIFATIYGARHERKAQAAALAKENEPENSVPVADGIDAGEGGHAEVVPASAAYQAEQGTRK
ncbi:sulfite exporter TauE/SafE family protein [Corynebacterium flavescens]|uniref:Probable membrane transporter protein n=1 Tax=Corynebacterium flavescens TaxID=28028 RepID=A0AB73B8Z1_CORFL|nr:sulfite exporter TauE/SafE family protein [Corynebacterium flavescens]KAA8724111.1 sulfite exporter TauE/SafE family protein [Corynebacterium flavescens]MDN6199202.1 sulfite exporter TauE/SafE family protein [Corynebacterium flavescens]MDN6226382.1 sulfite exporter TauE/SafE family protein [Corynebacterium flavescens]MDN6236874.1 sulfite exporter TauE/SafE family protein [Corynebacterium flavescens]MDN6431163.1 sulfite exporter TauE/SafE family protein [Corynebacterium flavescens]